MRRLLSPLVLLVLPGLLAACVPRWPGPYRAVPPEGSRPERLLAAMSVEQKVGQLMVVSFPGPAFSAEAEQMVRQYHVGGVILFQQNLQDTTQTKQLTGQLQRAARIPLLLAVDQEGGPVVRLTQGATLFPSQMAIGATFSPEAAAAAAGATARELRSLGFNANLGPVVDVNSNPKNPVIGVRSYGGDPALVGRLASAAIAATQQAGVLTVAKHFPGHGDADVDSHRALPVINHGLSRLAAVEFPPFQAAIAAGVDGVMTAHLLLPALEKDPRRSATLSAAVLGHLREQLGFGGLIVTDDLEMGAIVNDYGTAEAAKLAFQAGADVLLFRRNVAEQQRAHHLLVAAVDNGEVSRERLDASVKRILEAKARRGLLEQEPGARSRTAGRAGETPPAAPPAPSAPPAPPAPTGPAGANVALDVARRSLTLVKNDGGLLPLTLPDTATICAIYPRPEAVNEVEVAAGPAADQPQTLGEALAAVHPETRLAPVGLRPMPEEAQAAMACARQARAVALGSYNLHEYPSQAALMNAIAALGKPTVVVALRLPYDLGQLAAAPALLAAYSNRPASLRAVAEALVGKSTAPSGHLPVPVEPHWAFGFGLLEWSKPDTLR